MVLPITSNVCTAYKTLTVIIDFGVEHGDGMVFEKYAHQESADCTPCVQRDTNHIHNLNQCSMKFPDSCSLSPQRVGDRRLYQHAEDCKNINIPRPTHYDIPYSVSSLTEWILMQWNTCRRLWSLAFNKLCYRMPSWLKIISAEN